MSDKTLNRKIEYVMDKKIPVAVIYRKREKSQTEACPFCGCSHAHGVPDGFRVPHCVTIHKRGVAIPPKELVVASDGTELLKANGYYIITDGSIKSMFDTK